MKAETTSDNVLTEAATDIPTKVPSLLFPPSSFLLPLSSLLFPAALVLRLLCLPLNHYWDTQVWYNFFADLAQNHSPYDSFRELSFYARTAKINLYYEYFAYPPGLIYLYYPLAQLYQAFDRELTTHFPAPGTIPTFPVPFLFALFFKTPVIFADLLIGWLLRRMAGLKVAALYLFNPFVLLMSAWMFDSLMVLTIVAALYWLKQEKLERGVLALAAGTLIKFVPVLLVPALVIYLFQRGYSLRRISRVVLVYFVAVVGLVLPFAEGLSFVLGFHAQRVGGGLNWQSVWYFLSNWFPTTRWDEALVSFSGALGTIVLGLGLLLAYALIYRFRLSLNATFIATLAAYLAFTKLVNEVYVLPLLPLLLLELAQTYRPGLQRCYKLLWSIPLAWTFFNTPIFLFASTTLNRLDLVDINKLSLLNSLQPRRELSLVAFLVGSFFTVLCLVTLALTLKTRPSSSSGTQPEPLAETQSSLEDQPVLLASSLSSGVKQI